MATVLCEVTWVCMNPGIKFSSGEVRQGEEPEEQVSLCLSFPPEDVSRVAATVIPSWLELTEVTFPRLPSAGLRPHLVKFSNQIAKL